MKQIAALLVLLVLLPLPAWAGDADTLSASLTKLFVLDYRGWRLKARQDALSYDSGPRARTKTRQAVTFLTPNFDLFAPEPVDNSKPGDSLISYGCPASANPVAIRALRHDINTIDYYLILKMNTDEAFGWVQIPFGDQVKLVAKPDVGAIADGKQPKEWIGYVGQAKVTWRGRDLWCPAVCLGRSLPPGKSAADLRLTDDALRSKLGK